MSLLANQLRQQQQQGEVCKETLSGSSSNGSSSTLFNTPPAATTVILSNINNDSNNNKDNSMPSFSYHCYKSRPTEILQTTGVATAAAAGNSNTMAFSVKDYHLTPTNQESRAFALLLMDPGPQQQLLASLSIMASKNNKEQNNNNKSVSTALPATRKHMSPYFKSSVHIPACDAPLLAAASSSFVLPGGRR